jgi:hypothetical protein
VAIVGQTKEGIAVRSSEALVGALVLIAAGSLVVGVIFPNQRFSPPLRRAVEIFEAICIAVVLPLALAVMDLYSTLRHVELIK